MFSLKPDKVQTKRRWRAIRIRSFYLCARYNYAARGDVKESLSLYILGHIFEQSITELEYREGELEGPRDNRKAFEA